MPGKITSDHITINECETTTNFASLGTWASGGGSPAASNDVYLQGANAINARCSSTSPGTINLAFSHSSMPVANTNLTGGQHVYIWVKCICLPSMENRVRGGIGVTISSDTTPTLSGAANQTWSGPSNSKQWFVSGADTDPTSGWVSYVVDPTSIPDLTLGSPDITSVDRVGTRWGALQTVGGGSVKPLPDIWDRIAYGTGLAAVSGTVAAPVTFNDFYVEDSLTANQYGVITKVAGVYFVAGKLTIGWLTQSVPTTFTDTSQVLVYQDMPVSSTFYEIRVRGVITGTFSSSFTLGTYEGGVASNGCVIRGAGLTTQRLIAPWVISGGTGYAANDILTVVGGTGTTAAQFRVISVSGGAVTAAQMEVAGVYSSPPSGTISVTGGGGSSATFGATVAGGSVWTLTADATNTTTNLYGCSLSEMKRAAFNSSCAIRGTVFDNFGDITPANATFDNCTFQNLRNANPISASYALNVTGTPTITNCNFVNCNTAVKWNSSTDPNGYLDGSSFTSGGGVGHGIEFGASCPVSSTLTNVIFTGYGGTAGSNLVASSGATSASIYNNSGKDIYISINGGSTPSVRNGVGATTTVVASIPLEVNGLTEGSRALMIGSGGGQDGVILLEGYANSSGQVLGSYAGSTPQTVIIKARNSGLVAAVIQDDGGAYTDYTDDARDKTGTDDVALLPAVPAINDAAYIAGLAQFGEIEVWVTGAGTTYVITWEYYNGASWSPLTVTDPSNSFQTTGWHIIRFTKPTDWQTTTVNSQGPFYYVRARVTTGGGTGPSLQEISLHKTIKYEPFTLTTSIGAAGLTVTVVWIVDTKAR